MAAVVADTSFLFSLFGNDAHTLAAKSWAQQAQLPIAVTTLGRYELGNAIRFAAFAKPSRKLTRSPFWPHSRPILKAAICSRLPAI